MRAFVILLAGVCTLALATPLTKQPFKIADDVHLNKQRDILRLFNHVNQPSYYKEFEQISKTFQFENQWDQWTQPQYAKEFYYYYQHDILPQGEVFSVFYPEHLKQAISLFKVFYYARDYQTLFNAAVWARQNVNEGLYVYSLSVAVAHSKHTTGLILPPIYEIYPHYFFSDEVIYKAQQYKQNYFGEEETTDGYNGYTIHANYSGWYLNLHPEQSVNYFTEDVGVNSFYYYQNIYAPFWMENEEIVYDTSLRGEYFYWQHQQLLARYYLERLSNNLGEIPQYSYGYPIETGFNPSLHYPNGLQFPSRPNHANLYQQNKRSESYTNVVDYERRLRDALDAGYIFTSDGQKVELFTENGFQTLGLLVESNPESPNTRYYGDLLIFTRHLLGYSTVPLDQYQVTPSALEHFETSLRDPIFYQMYKRILNYFIQYQNYQGPYEQSNLLFNGVKIEGLTVDRLITYFDYHYSDLSNAVVVNQQEFDSYEVRARQYRLNHKPFNYRINVSSEKPVEALVKVFIGPKYDEYGRTIDINQNRINFFELDRFQYTLVAGQNLIERNSHENSYFATDRTTYKQLYQQVLTAINGGEPFKYYDAYKYYGFPQRFMLPKGDFGGQTFQLYVIVCPYHEQQVDNGLAYYLVDTSYSLGYPFDRPIQFENEFNVPNSYFQDVVIYHKNTRREMYHPWSKY